MTAQSEGAENTVEASYASTDGPRAISSQPAMASGSTGSCTIAAWLLWSIECFILARWSPAVLEYAVPVNQRVNSKKWANWAKFNRSLTFPTKFSTLLECVCTKFSTDR